MRENKLNELRMFLADIEDILSAFLDLGIKTGVIRDV